MMAMPIWDSMVTDRPLVNNCGATSITRANRHQTQAEPTRADMA